MSQQVVKPRVRGFICITSHPEGCAAQVREQAAYVKSRPRLEGGPKSVLVIGASTGYGLASRIAAAFGMDAVWAFKATREGNTVVLAQRTPSRPKRDPLSARAQIIRSQWGLPADKWVRVFKPLQP